VDATYSTNMAAIIIREGSVTVSLVSIPGGGWDFFSSTRPDLLWGPPSLLSMGTRGSFPGGKAAGA